MAIIERIRGICLKPKDEWQVIASETTSTAALLKGYALPLAAIGAVAGFIGTSFAGYGVARGLVSAVMRLALALAGAYALSLVIDGLAPKYGAEKNPLAALKVAVYSATPGWVAGILVLVPVLSPLALLAVIYGLYLLYLGLPRLMKCPPEKEGSYTIAVVASALGLAFVVYLVLRNVA